MRLLVLITGLALAVTAMAEDKPKPKSVAKEIDKSTPILANEAPPEDTTEAADAKEKQDKSKSRAQDYNSSRSNTDGVMPGGPDRDLGKETRCSMESVDNDCDGVVDKALDDDSDGDSIDTRDNNGVPADSRDKGQRGDEASGGKRSAGDYNSSRSNNINGEADKDDGDDPVVRKKPGKR